ncbi:MAG: DUF58 domain-containing protein [Candidatus Eremiobacteraeota bacterium]|nr:DUF58 domain-containing protein [Candidatus Eremiobacteraeota bacterium]
MSARSNALRNALLSGRRRPRNHGGGSPASYRGDGYEFAEVREYVAGDDPRRVDWAATARVGALQTRVILEDVSLTLAAVLDHSNSMYVGRRRSLFDAAREALLAWYHAAESDDRCIRVTGDRVISGTLRGLRSANLCANVTPRGDSSVMASLAVAQAALQRGSALLVISDFFETNAAHRALLAKAASLFDCTALIAQDPWRNNLPLSGFVRIKDSESGEVRHIFLGTRECRRYHEAVQERERMLRDLFTRSGWRMGYLAEDDGAAALMRAFGLG